MAGYSWEQNRADAQALADMLWTLYQCPVPLVGRIHGDCYAGGVGLAAVCDVLIAAEEATFCLSEARLGLLPATISPYVVRALGVQASRRYFTTAERFSAQQAHALGFVHEVVRRRSVIDDRVPEIVQTLVGQRADGGAGLQGAGAGRRRPRRSRRRCAPTPRAGSPTSAPATRAAKACRAFCRSAAPRGSARLEAGWRWSSTPPTSSRSPQPSDGPAA